MAPDFRLAAGILSFIIKKPAFTEIFKNLKFSAYTGYPVSLQIVQYPFTLPENGPAVPAYY